MIVTKKCNSCGVEKALSEFFLRTRSPDGHQSWCKTCTAKKNHEWYTKNKTRHSSIGKLWRDKNITRVREKQKEYYKRNRERELNKAKEFRRNNPDIMHQRYKLYAKKYRLQKAEYQRSHPEQTKLNQKKYRESHREQIARQSKIYRENNKLKINATKMRRINTDPVFARRERLRLAVREGINTAKSGGRHNKKSLLKTVSGLYSDELWEYLLNTWEKEYGAPWNGEPYQIDHIIPLCTTTTVEEVDKLFHYTNLRMLTPKDNIEKRKQDLASAIKH